MRSPSTKDEEAIAPEQLMVLGILCTIVFTVMTLYVFGSGLGDLKMPSILAAAGSLFVAVGAGFQRVRIGLLGSCAMLAGVILLIIRIHASLQG